MAKQNKNYTKKSGATLSKKYNDNKNELFIYGWILNLGRMFNVRISQTDKQFQDGVTVSKTDREWVQVLLVASTPLKNDVLISGLMNLENYKCYFKNWNWICNPKAPNGGYLGKHISKD